MLHVLSGLLDHGGNFVVSGADSAPNLLIGAENTAERAVSWGTTSVVIGVLVMTSTG
ncbi:MAG: hypothetical protein QRY16_04225 [Enterobacterales bacterium endosymbiont of Blomia tropicalis]|uniref:hypothetical protein n=1 Tax=Mixta mediterraneensis TaxID=2758443 RepID=UPI0025A90CA7|nr:hypothetical protein [Mixta mediterraneensis]MDL4913019.1 hypothetical protein [Mixta mediterraneensis]